MAAYTEKELTQQVVEPELSIIKSNSEDHEVFKSTTGGVDFRTVTWQRMIIIMLKVLVATGLLGIPSAMGTVGVVPGSLLVVGWQALNTCMLPVRGVGSGLV
jgi:hypothetical protein